MAKHQNQRGLAVLVYHMAVVEAQQAKAESNINTKKISKREKKGASVPETRRLCYSPSCFALREATRVVVVAA